MVLIAYNEAVDEEVMEVLKTAEVEGFTKWTKALGTGKASGPHLATHVWPKANNVLAVATDDETAGRLLAGVKELRQSLAGEGVKAFVMPIDDVT